jgi:putative ABC transport system permease protein
MTSSGHDLRYALRLLRQQPGFTAIALLTLALGIGATTAIFSVVNAVVLQPLPFAQSDRLIILFENNLQRGWPTFSVAPANFVDWARQSRTFQSMMAMTAGTAAIVANGRAEQVPATNASAEIFTVFRAVPIRGRAFVAGDDAPGAPAIAVMGHGLWQRRFGGDESIVGRVVTINERPTTIVGIMPQGFGRGSPDTALWLPLAINRAQAERGGRVLSVIGRLADGAGVDQARSEMDTLAAGLAAAYPGTNTGWGVTLVPLEEAVVGPGLRRQLMVLLGAVGFVLLIACVNVANLLSARSVSRQREIAIRAALGADRWRLLRQLLTESLVLAAAGGLLGVFIAVWGAELLLALAPPSIPRLDEVKVDGLVLAVGLATTIAAAVIFGLVPALQSITARPDDTLKDTTRGTVNPGRRRMSQAFVVAEVALAVVLLVGAGLLVRSFIRLSNQPIGFQSDHSLEFSLTLPEARYPTTESVSQFHRTVLDRIRGIPGIVAAGATHALPFSGEDSVRPFIRDGETLTNENAPTSEYRLVTPGYFAAMGIPVRRGREFTESDTAGQPGAVIINESFARRFFAGSDPLGKRLRQMGDNPAIPWLTVVGVVGDVRHGGLSAEIQPEMFWAESQATWGATLNRHRRGLTVVVRTTGDPTAMLPAIQAQVAAVDPNRPLIDALPMRALVARSADVERFSMVLLGLFASVGLVLSAAGVYGVMSYTVAANKREMGIRLALGARPRALLAQVLRTGFVMAAVGASVGLAAAWMLGDVFAAQLFQTPARDRLTFATVAALLLITALVACYVPARRAGRVDPIEALRE